MDYYAHSHKTKKYQLLKVHSKGVAQRCMKYAELFQAGHLGYLAGMLHDLGKYSELFQERIRGKSVHVDHSTAGARWLMEPEHYKLFVGTARMDFYLARSVAQAIVGHHGGLRNYGALDEEGTFNYRLSNRDYTIENYSHAWDELEINRKLCEKKALPAFDGTYLTKHNIAWKYSFLGRMLYSCLVDADSIDTRDYSNDEERQLMEERNQPTINELLNRFNYYMEQFDKVKDSQINRQRKRILAACIRNAKLGRKLFSLSVPTGGGKTLSSLAFALRHACEHELRRIIYVSPFTSITDQTAQKFREALGSDAVLEHHSNFDFDEYGENDDPKVGLRLKLSAENWDSPVVVTTSVQFFESLFASKRSKCRKLHQIAGSVIIIDEAQSIPRGYVAPCAQALQELVQSYGCSVVLCTATQPSWDKLGFATVEIMDDPTPLELSGLFAQVQISVHGDAASAVTDETVLQWMAEHKQALCIVNTRKHARLLMERLKRYFDDGVYHLSGRMYATNRKAVLKEIIQRLKDKLPCRVISTQLIEAGIDVDFPVVLRAFAGLDSIAQSAGRCNRERRRKFGKMYVFYPEPHGMPARGWIKESAVEAQHVIRAVSEGPLSLKAMEQYFDRIYGIVNGAADRIRVEASVIDSKGILALVSSKNSNLEIPYQDIADRFQFIEGGTHAVIIPFTKNGSNSVWDELNKLEEGCSSALRKLQMYTVQVYPHELAAMKQADVLDSVEGVLYLKEAGFYSFETGLRLPGDLV
ncbi:CRISPR-associated helicase Cas3' [Paenibacillus paeoniae]|nr:CRISPR-associated helicase Cas3' [Paenibacillus paeoniae]